MSLVRLQCPACASIVKISEEIAGKHPVVRCAKCQGLVNVASSRMKEPLAEVDESEEPSYRPKKKKGRKKSEVPVGLIAGIVVGLLVLVGAGFGVYFLIDHFSGSPLEKTFKRGVALMKRMADAVESIQTPQDVPKAFDQIKDVVTELKEMDDQNRKAGVDLTGEENKKLAEKYMPEVLENTKRIQAAMLKLSTNPVMARAFQEQAAKLGGAMAGLAALGNGFNMPGQSRQQSRDAIEKMAKEAVNKPPAPSKDYLEHCYTVRSNFAKMLPAILEQIRDNDSAEDAFFKMESIVQMVGSNNKQIEKEERELGKPDSALAQEAMREFQKTTEELAVQLARIEKITGLGLVHEKLVSKFSEAGLASKTTTVASNPPPGRESSNPFEPAASGGKPTAPGKQDSGNPFEPASGGGSSTKSMPANGNSGAMAATLAKLNSDDHFKKIEGLREAQSAKVEEASKAEVLDALLKLCDDNDVHQKTEVLKAFKKWATTQADKERLGEHAEVLLKDAFAKKDAMRYFGENKVISASKEVARLLKDTFERKDAAEALIAMGSDAEKSVTPHLSDLEAQVRQMAIEVLARIGTPASIPDLQKLRNDRFVGKAASQAISLINSRKK